MMKNLLKLMMLLVLTSFITTEVLADARVQVIHNSADAAAEVVDVWLNDILLLDDFTFRTASPFVDAPAGVEFTIAIKGPDSTNPDDPIWSQNYTLAEGETYILVAEGIVSASGYDPATPFDIAVYDMGREEASNTGNTDVLVHHGSTDAPIVDVYEIGVGAGEIVNDLAYAEFAGYLELGTLDYILDIRDETGMNSVAAYEAPLATLGLDGAAIAVVASGFLNPDNNSNGPAFGLWVALASGGALVELPLWTSIHEIITEDMISLYPNPVSSLLHIQFGQLENATIKLEVIDILGSKVIEEQLVLRSNQLLKLKVDVSELKSGLYFVNFNTGEATVTKKIQVVN